jgi:tRNA threonylcarbamoyladenosine biosynthesis protein TsaB
MSESWLVIETSGRIGRVGLARGVAVVRAAELDPARRHARDLAPTVDRLLKEEGLSPRELTGVMVSVGPGGYTGLRVGVMSAKALAFATGCRLVAVPTFHAIAEQVPAETSSLLVIADALQGMIYLQRFIRRDGTIHPADDLQIESAAESLPRLEGGAWVSGPGIAAHSGPIPGANPVVHEACRDPRVESIFRVGLRLPPATRDELFRLEPLYLRGSSAEEKAKKNPTPQPPPRSGEGGEDSPGRSPPQVPSDPPSPLRGGG